MTETWKEKYLQDLNNPKVSYFDLGKKIEQYRPMKLYKYMKFDDFWRKNIFEGQVFFSPSNTLNDPYDCLIYVNREEYGKYILKEIQMLFPMINKKLLREETIKCLEEDLKDIVSSLRKEVRVTCFTECFLSSLMWSHYANKHQGFCIEYDLSKLPDGYRKGILPILYSDTRCDVTKALITRNKNNYDTQ